MDLFDAVHSQHFAGRLARELVGTMTRTDRHGQGINPRLGNKTLGFVRIGQQLVARERAGRTVAIFLFSFARFQRTEATKLTFHRHTLRVCLLATSFVTLTL